MAGTQDEVLPVAAQLLEREFVADDCEDNVAVLRFDRAIHDQGVAIVNAEAGHRVTLDAHQKGRVGLTDQMRIEVDAPAAALIDRGRPAGTGRNEQGENPVT